MKVKTKVGEIETPELAQVGPRTKFWAEAMSELLRVDELYCVMGAALDEAYKAGAMNSMFRQVGEIIDAEDWSVIEAGPEGAAAPGPEPAESDVPGDGSRPAEPSTEAADVPGCDTESAPREFGHEAELAEDPKP
jgi:hypothetical protein